jgi:type IV secretory pathway VirJ component
VICIGFRRAAATLLAMQLATQRGAIASPQHESQSPEDVAGLPLHVAAPKVPVPTAVAILLSGDGGWADIDKRLSDGLVARGMGVAGVDSRAYFMRKRTPDETTRDVARVIRHFTTEWSAPRVVLIGYAHGADVAPFVANRLAADVRASVDLIALLAPAERASFHFHWLDLLGETSDPSDPPILPELERLRGASVLCVFGRDQKESLCRLADTTAVHVDARPGRHHFDGNYEAIAAEIARLSGTHATSAHR